MNPTEHYLLFYRSLLHWLPLGWNGPRTNSHLWTSTSLALRESLTPACHWIPSSLNDRRQFYPTHDKDHFSIPHNREEIHEGKAVRIPWASTKDNPCLWLIWFFHDKCTHLRRLTPGGKLCSEGRVWVSWIGWWGAAWAWILVNWCLMDCHSFSGNWGITGRTRINSPCPWTGRRWSCWCRRLRWCTRRIMFCCRRYCWIPKWFPRIPSSYGPISLSPLWWCQEGPGRFFSPDFAGFPSCEGWPPHLLAPWWEFSLFPSWLWISWDSLWSPAFPPSGSGTLAHTSDCFRGLIRIWGHFLQPIACSTLYPGTIWSASGWVRRSCWWIWGWPCQVTP